MISTGAEMPIIGLAVIAVASVIGLLLARRRRR